MNRILPLSLVLILSACASTPPIPERTPEEQEQAWQQHRQAVASIGVWSLTGRIAVNTEDEGWNGELYWNQTSGAYRIQFSAPFGQGAFQLDGGSQGVEMRFSDGQVFQAEDAETLLLQHLGWRLPLSGFRYWVTGLPEPQSASDRKLDGAGRLASLTQQQWKVSYPDYFLVGDIMMPRKVLLHNHDLSVRLVVDRWDLKGGA